MEHDAFRPPGDTRRAGTAWPTPATSPASPTSAHATSAAPPVPPPRDSPQGTAPRSHPAPPAGRPLAPTPGSDDRFATAPRTVGEAELVTSPFPGTEDVDPAVVFRGPGYTSPLPPTNGLSTTALWLTVVGVFLPPVLLVSGLLGAIGLARAPRLHRVGARQGGAALAISLVLIALWALIYVLVIAS